MRYEILPERLFSNFHRLILTNILFAIPSAVFFAAFYFAYFYTPVPLPVALLALIPLYPFYAGVVMVCRNIARGDSDVAVVKDFVRTIKGNFLPFLLHGVLIYAVSILSGYAISLYIRLLSLGWFFYIPLFFTALITLFALYAAFYIPLLTITYDLPLKYVYKNSLLMSFGELKNNLFATLALFVAVAVYFTLIFFSNSAALLLLVIALLWVLLVPSVTTFMYVFFVYDGMKDIMTSKAQKAAGVQEKDQIDQPKRAPVTQEDFSDIDLSTLKDNDDYIFHNGRMVKQSTLLRMAREQQNSDDNAE